MTWRQTLMLGALASQTRASDVLSKSLIQATGASREDTLGYLVRYSKLFVREVWDKANLQIPQLTVENVLQWEKNKRLIYCLNTNRLVDDYAASDLFSKQKGSGTGFNEACSAELDPKYEDDGHRVLRSLHAMLTDADDENYVFLSENQSDMTNILVEQLERELPWCKNSIQLGNLKDWLGNTGNESGWLVFVFKAFKANLRYLHTNRGWPSDWAPVAYTTEKMSQVSDISEESKTDVGEVKKAPTKSMHKSIYPKKHQKYLPSTNLDRKEQNEQWFTVGNKATGDETQKDDALPETSFNTQNGQSKSSLLKSKKEAARKSMHGKRFRAQIRDLDATRNKTGKMRIGVANNGGKDWTPDKFHVSDFFIFWDYQRWRAPHQAKHIEFDLSYNANSNCGEAVNVLVFDAEDNEIDFTPQLIMNEMEELKQFCCKKDKKARVKVTKKQRQELVKKLKKEVKREQIFRITWKNVPVHEVPRMFLDPENIEAQQECLSEMTLHVNRYGDKDLALTWNLSYRSNSLKQDPKLPVKKFDEGLTWTKAMKRMRASDKHVGPSSGNDVVDTLRSRGSTFRFEVFWAAEWLRWNILLKQHAQKLLGSADETCYLTSFEVHQDLCGHGVGLTLAQGNELKTIESVMVKLFWAHAFRSVFAQSDYFDITEYRFFIEWKKLFLKALAKNQDEREAGGIDEKILMWRAKSVSDIKCLSEAKSLKWAKFFRGGKGCDEDIQTYMIGAAVLLTYWDETQTENLFNEIELSFFWNRMMQLD